MKLRFRVRAGPSMPRDAGRHDLGDLTILERPRRLESRENGESAQRGVFKHHLKGLVSAHGLLTVRAIC